MVVEETKESTDFADKLGALQSSFANQTLNISSVNQSKVDGISIAPPITAWSWSKAFEN